jgi:hypothetical protein
MASLKIVSALLIICLVGCLAIGVYAALSYSQTLTWVYQNASESFSVQSDSADGGLGVITGSGDKTVIYTVMNDGNVPITVTASSVNIGCTTSWDKDSATIGVGESATFTLTVHITGEGSCVVSFA